MRFVYVLSAIFALLAAPVSASPYYVDEYDVLQLEDPSVYTSSADLTMDPFTDDDIRTAHIRHEFDVLGAFDDEESLYESPLFESPSWANQQFGYTPQYSSYSKKRLPTLQLQGAPKMAQAVELKPITSYVIREQPIKSPKTIIQPIIRQRLVEQPVTKTRVITQPVIRRLITQPLIQPHLIQTTNIQKKIIDQPITVPKITRQDIIKQVLVEQQQTNKPITRPVMVERHQPQVSTMFMGKNAPRQLSKHEALLAAHPEAKFGAEDEFKYGNNWMF